MYRGKEKLGIGEVFGFYRKSCGGDCEVYMYLFILARVGVAALLIGGV